MKVVKIQFHKADKEYFFLPEFVENSHGNLSIGLKVIVETVLGKDVGVITGFADFHAGEDEEQENNKDRSNIIPQSTISDIKPMLRFVTDEDEEVIKKQEKNYPKYLKTFRDLCSKHGLKEMKLVDVGESFDGNRLTFYFTADSRVDFRELVKGLVHNFHKKIRLQQIGVRDAAKIEGGIGSCGLCLCCGSWLNTLGNVTPDYIKDQELTHRGADRLTGPCARLKCCLRYEEENYKYHLDNLPKIGDKIKTRAGTGTVIAVHALRQTVDLQIDDAVVEYPYLEGKICQGDK